MSKLGRKLIEIKECKICWDWAGLGDPSTLFYSSRYVINAHRVPGLVLGVEQNRGPPVPAFLEWREWKHVSMNNLLQNAKCFTEHRKVHWVWGGGCGQAEPLRGEDI